MLITQLSATTAMSNTFRLAFKPSPKLMYLDLQANPI